VNWMRSIKRESDDWNGNMSYSDALNAAEFGQWSAPEIKNLTLPKLTSASDDMRYYYDVCGEVLDVSSFCSGEPEYWQCSEPIQKPVGRVLRFAVEIGGLGDISAERLKNRGEAIIAMVNSLELQGHSVEVTVVRAYTNRDGNSYKFLIPIKAAGQAIDIQRFQFIIGHPSFFRRCLFGLSELAQGKDIDNCGTRTEEYAPDGFIHISHKQGLCYSPRESMDWAKQFAQSIAAAADSQN